MPDPELQTSSILVVDDNFENTVLVRELLTFVGYDRVSVEMDSAKALEQIMSQQHDLVILDLHMPHVSGFDILRVVQESLPKDAFVPILVFTADWTETTRKRALNLGAWDFITKPFDATELVLRVENFLRMRYMHKQLQEQNRMLEAQVLRRTRRIFRARAEALECLARAGEFRDDVTGEHAKRVATLSGQIARELGLPETTIELIETAAPLHDLGKIGIEDSVLMKPGKLTCAEFETMKSHPLVGGTIIGRAKSPVLRKAREIALYHHEAWDGSGYPHGLSGSDIPISARIVAVADTFDALVSERPYKPAWELEAALAEIESLSGSRFDPAVVDAFLRVTRGVAAGN